MRRQRQKRKNLSENAAQPTNCCKEMNPNPKGWNAVAFKAKKVRSLQHVGKEKKNATTELLQLSLLNPHMCTVPKYSDLNEKKAPERTTRVQKCLGSRNLTSPFFCFPISLVFILADRPQSAYSFCGSFSWPSANTLREKTGQTLLLMICSSLCQMGKRPHWNKNAKPNTGNN